MSALKNRFIPTCLVVFGFLAAPLTPAWAVDIQTVTSQKGVKALLAEDYTVPLIAISFSFKGGATQDEPGKEGTAKLLTNMLDEGAGELKSQAFQEALDENGMNYSFSAGYDSFSGSIKTVVDFAPRSYELLRLMLTKPLFDDEPLARMKASRLSGLKRAQSNPRAIAGKAFREAIFAEHPYGRPVNGTMESMQAQQAEDLRQFHSRVFARDNLVIGVVGAISPDDLKTVLDQIFGDLPEKSQLKDVPEIAIETGKEVHVEFNTPQTNIRLVQPGIKRDDPDFFAAYLVNYVLGGGSFSSRLYDEVREKRGLAYGVYSYLDPYDHAGVIGSGTATRTERTDQALEVILEEIEKMGREGPTAEELEKAKKYITGSYAIANLDTSGKIAGVLVAIQQADLGLDYIDKRAEYIANVTLDDAKRVAKDLFSAKPTVITVGRKAN